MILKYRIPTQPVYICRYTLLHNMYIAYRTYSEDIILKYRIPTQPVYTCRYTLLHNMYEARPTFSPLISTARIHSFTFDIAYRRYSEDILLKYHIPTQPVYTCRYTLLHNMYMRPDLLFLRSSQQLEFIPSLLI